MYIYDRGKPCFLTISNALRSNTDLFDVYSVAIS